MIKIPRNGVLLKTPQQISGRGLSNLSVLKREINRIMPPNRKQKVDMKRKPKYISLR